MTPISDADPRLLTDEEMSAFVRFYRLHITDSSWMHRQKDRDILQGVYRRAIDNGSPEAR